MDAQILSDWDKEFNPNIRYNAGLDYDIERFIYAVFNAFDENQEPRFTIFCKLWKESNFGLIFCGRESFRELFEFTMDIMQRAKQYTRSSLHKKENNILIRYAAVYLLYSIYFKQPCRPRVRIKLTFEEFTDLLRLMEEARRDQHYDILYAWNKLVFSGAFHYSVVSNSMGMDVAKSMERRDRSETEEVVPTLSYFRSKDFQNMMRRLGKAHDNYIKIKESVTKDPNSGYSLDSMDVNLMERINEITKVGNEEQGSDRKPLDSEIGDKRKRLKERFFNLGFDKKEQV